MTSIEDEFKKAESIINMSERLIEKGISLNLKALEKIIFNIHDTIIEDTTKYSGFLDKMNDITILMDDLSKKMVEKR